VQGAGYFKFEVEIDAIALELEMNAAALELEVAAASASGQVVCLEISKHEMYSVD
jgi:hypothetical protein